MTINTDTLGPAEQTIFEALGNRRWTQKRYTPTTVKAATAVWNDLRQAVGFSSPGGWTTTSETNPKLGKSGLPTEGVTLHAAKGSLRVWISLHQEEQAAVAEALDTSVEHLRAVVAKTVCPNSTRGCEHGCVVAHSQKGEMPKAQRTRLARTLLTLVRPADALALTAKALDGIGEEHGRFGSRWRVNIADDIRWELLAPGLFKFPVRPYTYTKWSPQERPEALGMRIVYSASEAHSDAELVARCKAGHRVCIVFDLAKSEPLPATWYGIRVVDGDKTDDLWEHPAGSVVGLRVKGKNNDVKEVLRKRGFARPVPGPAARPLSLPPAHIVPVKVAPRRRAA